MRPLAWGWSVALLVGYLIAAVAVAGGQENSVSLCEGLYKGRFLTPDDLTTVLNNHRAWLHSKREPNDTRKANLCQARLSGANLQKADLSEADLQGTELVEANLQEANLIKANLQRARLFGANLQEANLIKANLHQASLYGAGLSEADLREATLQEADLTVATLQGANLNKATLRGAMLYTATLQEADLSEADLQGANLNKATLRGAILRETTLQGANLSGADLQGATLIDLELKDANLRYVNLTGAVLEIKPGALPTQDIPSIGGTGSLNTLSFFTSPHTLIELREGFKKAGLRQKEREVTYAIEHTKMRLAWGPLKQGERSWLERLASKGESLFNYVLFELPSGYGLVPSRALATLGCLILGFSLVYMVALVTARGRAGIWVTWPTDRVYQEEGAKEATRVTNTFFFPRWQVRAAGHWWGVLLRGVCVPLIGLYFSILSAFSLGWRELNVGTWIARMQPREYTLRATGWVRTMSGIQSLLSVYLLALWVLTYFGRPFE
jgi:uncharacterized protein YjbI with pentapeptide repeats